MTRAVVFDIDNTLYSFDHGHDVAWRALTEYARRELSLSAEEFNSLHRLGSLRLEEHCGGKVAAVHNRLIRYQLTMEVAGLPVRHAPVMARLYWETLMDDMTPYPGVMETLDRLKAAGLTLGIGTNMTADYQFDKLSRMGMLDRFDFIVTSEEVNAEKPDARLFGYCARKAGCPIDECVFVGDSLEGDVLGAMNAGMRAVWFHPEDDTLEAPPGALRLRAFGELPELLREFD